jgi:galactokinase
MIRPQTTVETRQQFNLQDLRNSFRQLYGSEPRFFSAPGRINLIGEHTDYNEGFVLPMAADRRTYVAAAARNDRVIRVHSSNLDEQSEFDLDQKWKPAQPKWLLYVEGIARVLEEKGFRLKGADLDISSEVPIGAGLSSSAALEVSVGFALLKLAEADIDLMQLALSAQAAEHLFVGTACGLMDQLTAAYGVANHAMLIDCRSLERQLVVMNVPNMTVVICDTGVKHELATSAYNERRQQCEQAVKILQEQNGAIRSLRDVTFADFETHKDLLPEPLRRRCRHVVSENERTLSAVGALKQGDVERLGELINLSHESLRDDYEVSCRELDLMVELARGQEGVAGARMMGGGFGGSTVNLVARDKFNEFRRAVSEGFQRETGLIPTVIAVEADDGVGEIS